MDRGRAEPAEVLGRDCSVDREARRASIIDVDEDSLSTVEARINGARAAISDWCGLSLGACEGSSFVRYAAGDFYRRHRDRLSGACWSRAGARVISVVVFLNSSSGRPRGSQFAGGDLLIFPEPSPASALTRSTRIVPRRGQLVAFHASALHEVLPVRSGTRDVIVDWFHQSDSQ
jgi:predicted 2-oxoglutarate/Fe(II)-dependent dioxygenase YbiX